jgi:phthiodiolone/phenolphthiodiolone dimycocerosates ketoreductase
MSDSKLEVVVPNWVDRSLPPEVFLEVARQIDASPDVDYMQLWDQMTFLLPRSLWTPEITPMANVIADIDSFPDWYVMAAYAAQAFPDLGIMLSTDSIRRGPAEFLQTALTLANVTKGKLQIHMGAGEVKQCQPFGWKRAQGLDRLEDNLRIFHKFMESDAPIDFEGHHWKLDQAWIGQGAKQYRPGLWTMGGGPRIIDIGTSYADGFGTCVPWVWSSPEHCAEEIGKIKEQLERKGRDPEQFRFGVWAGLLVHEDPEKIDAGLDHPIIRWLTAIFGRIIQSDWLKEGIEPPFPPDYHYAIKLKPIKIGPEEAQEILGRTTREHAERSWIRGTPAEVAAEVQGYIDAGASFVSLMDCLPLTLEPEDSMQGTRRSIEITQRIKSHNLAVH